MTDSWSAGDTALPDSKEKTTAQSAPNKSAPGDEHGRPGDAHATEAAKDSAKHAIAAANQTPQRQSLNFWGFMASIKKKKKLQQ